MNWKHMPTHARMKLAALLILVLGLVIGGSIYLTAARVDDPGASYQIINGQIYTMSPEESKAYTAQLERFGGKSAVYADAFNRWLAGLWRGPQLGLTIASLAALLAAVLFILARLIEREHADKKRPA